MNKKFYEFKDELKPGMMLNILNETKFGSSTIYYLVGDINTSGISGDGFESIDDYAIVRSYKQLDIDEFLSEL